MKNIPALCPVTIKKQKGKTRHLDVLGYYGMKRTLENSGITCCLIHEVKDMATMVTLYRTIFEILHYEDGSNNLLQRINGITKFPEVNYLLVQVEFNKHMPK